MRVFLSVADRSASLYLRHIFKDTDLELFGITDEGLESIGVRSIAKIEEISAVGILEAIYKAPRALSLFGQIQSQIRSDDVLLLCDAPGFNLRLLKKIRVRPKRIIYFISPQVWAWKSHRAFEIARSVDAMVCILPFEPEFYKKLVGESLRVYYEGHPLLDIAKPKALEQEMLSLAGGDYITIMPGSRWSEIKRHTPFLKKVIKCLRTNLKIVIPTFKPFESYLKKHFPEAKILTYQGANYDALKHARFSIIASGTASLEAGLLNAPHVVFYRVSPITYLIAKRLVKVPFVSLVNLILNRALIPEFIQASYKELCLKARQYLEDSEKLDLLKKELSDLYVALGPPGAIERLRSRLLELIKEL
ncbi:MAG: lipid-A-disaccharide synthase [Aquificaceae bacterium]